LAGRSTRFTTAGPGRWCAPVARPIKRMFSAPAWGRPPVPEDPLALSTDRRRRVHVVEATRSRRQSLPRPINSRSTTSRQSGPATRTVAALPGISPSHPVVRPYRLPLTPRSTGPDRPGRPLRRLMPPRRQKRLSVTGGLPVRRGRPPAVPRESACSFFDYRAGLLCATRARCRKEGPTSPRPMSNYPLFWPAPPPFPFRRPALPRLRLAARLYFYT